jgi:hypothetical protein
MFDGSPRPRGGAPHGDRRCGGRGDLLRRKSACRLSQIFGCRIGDLGGIIGQSAKQGSEPGDVVLTDNPAASADDWK